MNDITVAILAGGNSKRFGTDKAFVEFNGRALISHMIDIAKRVSPEILVVVSEDTQAELIEPYVKTGKVVVDPDGEPKCALTGALTAFEYTETSHTLLLPVDSPLVNVDVLKLLVNLSPGHGAVVPSWPSGYIEPLHSVYLAEHAYTRGLSAMSEGKHRMAHMLEKLQHILYISTEALKQFDPELDTFINFNTPQELKKAERRFKSK